MAELVDLSADRQARWHRLSISMITVYAISSLEKNYIYVGMTKDLVERLRRHNRGREKTTRPYAPFELIYTEVFENRTDARKREKYWKSGIGKERLKKIKREKQK